MSRKAFRSLTLVPVVALSMQLTACSDDASVADDSTTTTFTTTGGETETGDTTTTGAEAGTMDSTTNGDGDGDGDGDSEAEAEATGDGDGDGDGDATGDGDGDGDTSGDGDGDGDGDSCLTDDPCVNGTCNDAGGTITCSCATGWAGNVCDTCDVGYHPVGAACIIDEDCTATDPCTSNGTCNDSTGIIVCDCTMGYAGDTCDTCDTGYHDEGGACVIDESCAANDPCQNGTCGDGGGIISCTCDTGWTSEFCDSCANGYHDEGGLCVIDTNCEINTCGGNGSCDDTGGVPTCTCFMGYAGTFCDSCDSGYHDEGGVCVIDETCGSAADTCVNGTCFIAGGVVNCDCDENYEGDDCDTCPSGRFDCNEDVSDGCESFVSCSCTPGASRDCYDGYPSDTEDVGECEGGTQTCNPDGHSWSGCTGQTIPTFEICGNNADDDCDGAEDESDDADNDGYGTCEGDCCDSLGPNCGSPGLVNPGAFEVVGDGVDNDCDPGTSDTTPAATCDTGIASNTGNFDNYARAMDLCQFTTLGATGANKKWGVITGSGNISLTDGNPANGANDEPLTLQRAVRPGFGAIAPQNGQRIAVLSTGSAADSNDASPSHIPFEPGYNGGADFTVGQQFFIRGNTTVNEPASWYASPNRVDNAPGCPETGTRQLDPVMFTMDIRVPTNANSFSAKMYYMSSEFPEYVCSIWNDIFITLIDSSATNTDDNNIAVYDSGANGLFPLGINVAEEGLIPVCDPDSGPVTGTAQTAYCSDFWYDSNTWTAQPSIGSNTCTSQAELAGTGMDDFGQFQFCGGGAATRAFGGGTGWLQMAGNVTPGEVVTLRFAIWDNGDRNLDSVVILDDFIWSTTPATPGVTPA